MSLTVLLSSAPSSSSSSTTTMYPIPDWHTWISTDELSRHQYTLTTQQVSVSPAFSSVEADEKWTVPLPDWAVQFWVVYFRIRNGASRTALKAPILWSPQQQVPPPFLQLCCPDFLDACWIHLLWSHVPRGIQFRSSLNVFQVEHVTSLYWAHFATFVRFQSLSSFPPRLSFTVKDPLWYTWTPYVASSLSSSSSTTTLSAKRTRRQHAHASKVKLTLKKGNFLDATEDLLVHQCNCVTKTAAGLADRVFTAFPESNIYQTRTTPSIPGTIVKCGRIVNLFGQYEPGSFTVKESSVQRLQWFQQALTQLKKLSTQYHTVAFPYHIGCGLAGGQWKAYRALLSEFARTSGFQKVVVYQYKKSKS